MGPTLSQEQLWLLRAMIQRLGWKQFFYELASLMAEQADKVKRDSTQDKTLASFSNMIHTGKYDDILKDMGVFNYATNPLTPSEYLPLLNANLPQL